MVLNFFPAAMHTHLCTTNTCERDTTAPAYDGLQFAPPCILRPG